MRTAPDAYAEGRVRLKRECRGDRVAHIIELHIGGQFRPVLESLEPTSDGERAGCWPASPPLKDWHFEQRAEAAVFMAVGTAGKSHWSASIEIARTGAMRFDVAARVAGPPSFLGSQYQCLESHRLIDAACIELLPDVPLFCDPATARMRLDGSSCTLVIEPLAITAENWPQTIRWRYWIGGQPP